MLQLIQFFFVLFFNNPDFIFKFNYYGCFFLKRSVLFLKLELQL